MLPNEASAVPNQQLLHDIIMLCSFTETLLDLYVKKSDTTVAVELLIVSRPPLWLCMFTLESIGYFHPAAVPRVRIPDKKEALQVSPVRFYFVEHAPALHRWDRNFLRGLPVRARAGARRAAEVRGRLRRYRSQVAESAQRRPGPTARSQERGQPEARPDQLRRGVHRQRLDHLRHVADSRAIEPRFSPLRPAHCFCSVRTSGSIFSSSERTVTGPICL